MRNSRNQLQLELSLDIATSDLQINKLKSDITSEMLRNSNAQNARRDFDLRFPKEKVT